MRFPGPQPRGKGHLWTGGEETLSQRGLGRPEGRDIPAFVSLGSLLTVSAEQVLGCLFLKGSQVWSLCDQMQLPGRKDPTPKAGSHLLSVGDRKPADPVASQGPCPRSKPVQWERSPFLPRSILICLWQTKPRISY